jgi:hypothetical protein
MVFLLSSSAISVPALGFVQVGSDRYDLLVVLTRVDKLLPPEAASIGCETAG